MDVDTSQTHATPPPQLAQIEAPGDPVQARDPVAPMDTDPSSQATQTGESVPANAAATTQPPQVTHALPEVGAGDGGQEGPMDTDPSVPLTNLGQEGNSEEATPIGSEGCTPLGVRNGLEETTPGEAVTPAGQTIVAPPQMHTGVPFNLLPRPCPVPNLSCHKFQPFCSMGGSRL